MSEQPKRTRARKTKNADPAQAEALTAPAHADAQGAHEPAAEAAPAVSEAQAEVVAAPEARAEVHEAPLRVVITGAAGALGGALVRQASAAGHRVIAVDLHDADLKAAGVAEVRLGDLTSRRFCQEAVLGADVVIHAAARNDPGQSYEALTQINFEAVRWLYEASEDAGAKRFVHVSAASLYKPSKGVLREDSELSPDSTWEQTKVDAEQFLASRATGALPWVILRPSLMYGPGAKSFGAALLTVPPMLRLLFPYVPGVAGGPRNNWIHVEDLASAALLVGTHPEAQRQIYNVADDTFLSVGEILNAIIQSYGLELGPTVAFPSGLLGALAPLVDSEVLFRALSRMLDPLWGKVVQRHKLKEQLHPTLHRSGFLYLQGDRLISTERLKGLGWRPSRRDLRQSMGEVVRWYQQAGWVPDYHALPSGEPEDGLGLALEERLEGRAKYAEHVVRESEDDLCELVMGITFANIRKLFVEQDAVLEGMISVDHLVERAPIQGTLRIQPLHRKLVYEFGFEGEQGARYRFQGEKTLTLLGNVKDFARLEGRVIGSRGEEVARLGLAMELKAGLGHMLKSVRPVLR